MAELQFPNIAGSFYGGYANGLNTRLVKEGEQRRSRLSELAGQAYTAPQDQRQALIAQAVGVDPEAGFALEGSLGKSDDARAQTLVNAAKYLQAAPEAQRASVWRTMQPQLVQKLGIDLPVDYNDEVAQTAQAIVQTYGGAQSDGVRGSVVGRRIVNPVTGEVIYEAPQETQYQWSEANGAWIPKPGGESAPAAAPAGGTVFRTSNGELFDVSQVTDPTMRAEIMSKPEQYGLLAEAGGGSVDLGRRDVSQQQSPGLAAVPVAGIGPKQQAQSDIERRLDLARKMGASPEQLQAIVLGNASTKGPSAAEQRDALARKSKQPQVANAVRGLDRIEAALKALTGGLVNTGPIDQYAVRYTKAGQELESAVGGIQNSLLSLTRVPGIGSQSDLEARIAAMQYPSLDKDPEVNKRTVENLRAFIQDLQDAYRMADAPLPAEDAPQSNDIDSLLDMYN